MRKITFIIPILTFSLLASCNNNKAKVLDLFKRADIYDETGETLMGYSTFEYKNNLLVKETSYDLADEIVQQEEFSYDEHNNMVLSSLFNGEDITQVKYDYTYDDKGRVISEIRQMRNDDKSQWNIDEKVDYTYEEFKTSAIAYGYYDEKWYEKNRKQWLYDDQNRLIEKTHQSDYQNLKETHKYDEYGCDVEIINKNIKAGTIEHKKECEYYKHLSNRPSKIVDEISGLVEEYEYNSHLDITLSKEYKSDTPDKYRAFIRYLY